MEYWEDTLERAQKTLPVWRHHVPAITIGVQGVAALEALIDGFEPLAQAREAAQADCNPARREVQSALTRLKTLGTKMPALIEAHLEDDTRLMQDVRELYRTTPRSEPTILKRAWELHPVWVRANEAMAALTPPQPPLVRSVDGVPHTAAMLKALLDGYADLISQVQEKESLLRQAHEALRAHNRATDSLNKRWYRMVKAGVEMTEHLEAALHGIPTETGTAAPTPIEISKVTQGGEGGLQVLVTYAPGGGKHATTRTVEWMVVGDDEDFTHTAPLLADGNALGLFAPGEVVKVRTLVGNSAATRTTAPRTFTIGEPIG